MRQILGTAFLALLATSGHAESRICLDCHDDGAGSPAQALMQTAHGELPQACEACHGPSLEHVKQPTIASPDVSFGPRWTANTSEQDYSCLACHQSNMGKHWNEALHMANNVTCVTCHNAHDPSQDLANARQQRETCTTCHKTQKSGIHGREQMVPMNPPCTQCHNPHADQRPIGMMLANDSAGCRRCHNLDAMEKSEELSERVKGFHRVMTSGDRTCIDCHQGVAHGDPDSSELFMPLPQSEGEITLFYPGQSDADWLLTEHRGSQPLRQGSNCRQCHRGEEAAMGAALGEEEPSSRAVTVTFEQEGDELLTRLSWPGSESDTRVSMMWGFGSYEPFRRGGCWAACHGDMAGMSLDRDTRRGKYLWSALSQRRQINRQAVFKPETSREEAMAEGDFAEIWQIDLSQGSGRVGTVLEEIRWLDDGTIRANARYEDGQWRAEFRRPLRPAAPLLPMATNRRYTSSMARI